MPLTPEAQKILTSIKDSTYKVWGEWVSGDIAANILSNIPEGYPYLIEVNATKKDKVRKKQGKIRLRFTLIERKKEDIDFHDKQFGNVW